MDGSGRPTGSKISTGNICVLHPHHPAFQINIYILKYISLMTRYLERRGVSFPDASFNKDWGETCQINLNGAEL